MKWLLFWVSIMPNETTWTNSTNALFATAEECERAGLSAYLQKMEGMDIVNEEIKSLDNRIRVPLMQFSIKDTWSCVPLKD
jgi:hypothetical protein